MQLQKKLNDDYPEAADSSLELKLLVDDFARNLPLIRCFTSEAVGDEEWLEI
jgi:hypothetical protein